MIKLNNRWKSIFIKLFCNKLLGLSMIYEDLTSAENSEKDREKSSSMN